MSDPYLGTRTLMRAFLDAVSPDGAIHHPAPGGDMDHLLDGIGDGLQAMHDYLQSLGYIRDPWRTPFLDELEREYGVTPNTQLTDAQRRATLAMVKYKRNQPSTISTLQDALDRAGLGAGGCGLIVYANDPAVDPGPFTNYSFQVYLGGGNNQYLGYNTGGIVRSYMGINGGLWVVNGDVFTQAPAYESLGGSQSFLGYFRATPGAYLLGEYYSLTYTPIIVSSPTDSWTWPMVFFIAAGATKDGGGHITALTMGLIPGNMRQTLIEIILRWKPLDTWCALMCNFS